MIVFDICRASHCAHATLDAVKGELCRLLDIGPPESMDGRVLWELLAEGPAPGSVKVEQREYRVSAERQDGFYESTLHMSVVEGHRYVDYTRAGHEEDE